MNIKSKGLNNIVCILLLAGVIWSTGCTVKYSFSGASISPLANTVSIAYFPNNSTLVAPILSATFTDALQDRFQRQTRLSQVREDGDLNFEGEITNYTSTNAAISAQDNFATLNRLTITVRVRFTNSIEPQYNFDRSFSASQEYDSNTPLQTVEPQLIPEIVEMLVDDIFNAAVSNW